MVSNVLFESDRIRGHMYGFTENYIKVKTNFNNSFVNNILAVKLVHTDEEGVYIYDPNE